MRAFRDRSELGRAVDGRDWDRVAQLSDALAHALDEGVAPEGIYKIGSQPMQGADAHAREAVERFHRALARARARAKKKGR